MPDREGAAETRLRHMWTRLTGRRRLRAGALDGEEGKAEALADMTRRWPAADFVEDQARTTPYAARIFDADSWSPDTPLRVVMIGSDFEVRVWETLLKIPFGKATTYGDIARHLGKPNAARAVGALFERQMQEAMRSHRSPFLELATRVPLACGEASAPIDAAP